MLELEETFEAGVRREVREETGVEVEVDRLTGVYKNISRGVVALVLRCHPHSTAARSTDKASRIRWLTADEITEHDEITGHMDPAYAVRVTNALFAGLSPVTRAHDGTNLITA